MQGGHAGKVEADIPFIDLNAENAAADLLDAAASQGFVFVKHENIDVSPEDVDEIFKLSREFFASPQDEKAECTINSKASGKNQGWLPMRGELLDTDKQKGDCKEAFNIGAYANGKAQQPLPKSLQPHEERIGRFFEDCHALCNRIMMLFAVALKIRAEDGGPDWFSMRHDRSKGPYSSILRLLYYPALPPELGKDHSEDIRAGAHSDYGSVTLLFRLPGQPGLEVFTPQGDWATVPVDPTPGSGSKHLPILVNIGDLLSYWTNGLLKSTVHRVVFPKPGQGPSGGEDRYSVAYFCHPLDDAKLVEIPSEVIASRKARSNGQSIGPSDGIMTAKDHLNSRLAATYVI